MRPPDLAGLLLATALHAALVGAAWLPPHPEGHGVWMPVVAEVSVDIVAEPESPAKASSAPETEAPSAVAVHVVQPASAPRVPERAWNRLPAPTPEASAQANAQANAPASAPATTSTALREYDRPPPAVPIRGSPLWVPPGGLSTAAPAPTAAPKPVIDRSVASRLLSDPAQQRDRSLGLTLPAAGNVASALASAVRSALGPAEGSATFLVILTPAGKLLGIRPIAWNGGTEAAWESAARTATTALQGRSFTMLPPFDNGAVVWVDVTAAFVLPSGATARVTPDTGGFRFDVSDIGRRRQQIVRTTFRVAAVK